MKKIKLTGKLALSKETIKQLDESQLTHVNGGWTNTCLGSNCGCIPTTNCVTQASPCVTIVCPTYGCQPSWGC